MKTRTVTVIAQDPSVKSAGKILRSQLVIPWESLQPGPKGSRFHVIDHDFSTDTTYKPTPGLPESDLYAAKSDKELLDDPSFHAVNTYAVCMSILSAFEKALGRRIGWAFRGPQLKIAPHAFAEANAYYSRSTESLLFGYIPEPRTTVFTCLSHDIIAHETTHAIVDALRPNYMRHSLPDQVGFHEGFSDLIALLSVLAQENVIAFALSRGHKTKKRMISKEDLSIDRLKDSVLFGLANQFGSTIDKMRGALRRSIKLKPGNDSERPQIYLDEPHYRGEILVAAMMSAFLEVWYNRFNDYLEESNSVSRMHVISEGVAAARHLRTIIIRALDYVPPIHLSYEELLVGIRTADRELYPEDKYNYRDALLDGFKRYGITINSETLDLNLIDSDLCWRRESEAYSYMFVHADGLQYDKNEAYRFVWDNKEKLRLHHSAYTEITSVNPIIRYGADGFVVRETIIEYLQLLNFIAGESEQVAGIRIKTADENKVYRIHGGGVIIMDEYSRVKYHVHSKVTDSAKQQQYVNYLDWIKDRSWASDEDLRFSRLHVHRMVV